MTIFQLPPLHPGPVHLGPGGPPPFIGGFMFLLLTALIVGTLLFLARRGRLGGGPPSFFRSPEHDARTTLANRFAQGDISTDEFLERAAVLNWTPGVHDGPAQEPRKKR